MDLLISGKPQLVARARAAMASRLTTSAAHLTISAEAQAIEDRLAALARPPTATSDHPPRFDDAAAAEFAAIDEQLSTLDIPYEEWEVLYRQRLQVERDLRAGAMAGEAVVGAETPGVRREGAARRARGSRPDRPDRGGRRDRGRGGRARPARRSIAWPGREWRWVARAASVAVDGGHGSGPRPRGSGRGAERDEGATDQRSLEQIRHAAAQEPSATS